MAGRFFYVVREQRAWRCVRMQESIRKMESGQVRFGVFVFDPARGELWRNGVLVRLQPQPAQALACLVTNNGQVVEREDLRRAVWGAETFVDFERGLNFCIAQVRAALGDDASAPRYIQTIPKRGYRFIAPVERCDAAEEVKAPAHTPPRRPARVFAFSCAGVLLLAVAFWAGYWVRARHRAQTVPVVAVVRFDNETGDPAMTRFSDGLTDTVVEQLTLDSRQRYGVIGNAKILRVGREQRDLNAIATSLHAAYVVLGQVQSEGQQTRILAHLVRMPDQTHLWVARLDRPLENSLSLELETAQTIGAAFSERVVEDSSGSRLPPFPNH